MKKTVITFALLFCAVTLGAQVWRGDNISGKQFYVEGGGPGVGFSANIDMRFRAGNGLGWGWRAGTGFFWVHEERTIYGRGDIIYIKEYRSVVTLPIGVNYVFGKTASPHALEVGAGATILTRRVNIFDDYDGNLLGHFTFMYRRKPLDGGFTCRIGFTPMI